MQMVVSGAFGLSGQAQWHQLIPGVDLQDTQGLGPYRPTCVRLAGPTVLTKELPVGLAMADREGGLVSVLAISLALVCEIWAYSCRIALRS